MDNTGVETSNQAEPLGLSEELKLSLLCDGATRLSTLVPQHFRIATAHLRQINHLLVKHPHLHSNASVVSAEITRLIPLVEAMHNDATGPEDNSTGPVKTTNDKWVNHVGTI